MTSLFELPSKPEGHLHLLMRSRRAVSSTAPVLLLLRGQQSVVDGTWQDMTQHRALWRRSLQWACWAKHLLCTNRTLQREGPHLISSKDLFIWKFIQNWKLGGKSPLGALAFNCNSRITSATSTITNLLLFLCDFNVFVYICSKFISKCQAIQHWQKWQVMSG